MQLRTKVPIKDILQKNRLREDYGDIDWLADSLDKHGLIQPVVLNQDGILIAGGRRITAAQKLGWEDIDVVYKETLDEADLHELELVENICREDMTWQEYILGVQYIHQIKMRDAALDPSKEKWSMELTGAMLGRTRQRVQQILPIAKYIKEFPESPAALAATMAEAIKLILAETEEEAKKLNATTAMSGLGLDLGTLQKLDLASKQSKSFAPTLPPDGRISDEPAAASTGNEQPVEVMQVSIDLGRVLYNGNSLDILRSAPEECVDHILTDPPYGIDMKNLQQNSSGMDVSSTAAQHDRFENIELLKVFIPLAYRVMRPRGFFVMFCDYEHWHWLKDDCEVAGFRVQSWPNHWIKQHGLNQAAGFNFTKATECVLVASKSGATLSEIQHRNWHMIEETDADRKQPHPFAKPRALWLAYIRAISHPGQTLLDPFAGCGSMVQACIEAGRQFRAIESEGTHFADLLTGAGRELMKHFTGAELTLTYNKHAAFVEAPKPQETEPAVV